MNNKINILYNFLFLIPTRLTSYNNNVIRNTGMNLASLAECKYLYKATTNKYVVVSNILAIWLSFIRKMLALKLPYIADNLIKVVFSRWYIKRTVLVFGLEVVGDVVLVTKVVIFLHICNCPKDAVINLLRLGEYSLGMV